MVFPYDLSHFRIEMLLGFFLNCKKYLFVFSLLHFVMVLSFDELQHLTASIN